MVSRMQKLLAPGLAALGVIEQHMGPTPQLLGPGYPPPSQLASDAIFQDALSQLDATLDSILTDSVEGLNTTLSVSAFSAPDDGLLYERHSTSQRVKETEQGCSVVDGDCMYRIGSISKLLTVYTFLLESGHEYLSHPVTRYVPELLEGTPSDSIARPDWDEITLGDLAGHTSGMTRQLGWNDLAVQGRGMTDSFPRRLHSVFPPLSDTDKPTCGYEDSDGHYKTCDGPEMLASIAEQAAALPASFTPMYCNDAYALLAIALERITGAGFERMLDRSLFEPLALTHSSYSVPKDSEKHFAVIPGNATESGWANEFGAFAPAGGNYMSLKDLSRLGRSILNNELLSKAETRRWLRPVSLLSELPSAIGMPWEVERIEVGGRTLEIYTKSGDWNVYDSQLILIPEYNLGFSILVASDAASMKQETGLKVLSTISAEISERILPSVEKVAKKQAASAFAGEFYSSNDHVSHSISVAVDSQPRLKLTAWRYNGTDVLEELERFWGQKQDVRLVPNELYGKGKAGFTGISGGHAWQTIDALRYGNVGLEHFVFGLDDTGSATSLQAVALRGTLPRLKCG